MAHSNGQFISVFKINGKPILPPVIDENRRTELLRDRMLAIETERRLQLKRKVQQIFPDETIMGNINEALNKDGVDCNASNYDTSAAIDSLLDDNVQTLRNDDIEQSSVTGHSSSDESHANDANVDTKSSCTVPLTLAIDSNFNSITPKMRSPNFSLHSSPSVGALDESRNLSLYFTPMSGRESFSPIPPQKGQLTSARLIRSNSYTLDKPSPMLLKHMESSGINLNVNDSSVKSPMATNRFRNNQSSTSTCIPRKSTTENVKEHKSHSTTAKMSIGAAKQTISTVTTNITTKSSESMNNNGLTKSNSIKSTKVSNKSTSKRQASNPPSVFKNNESILRSIYGQKPVANKVQHSNKKNNNRSTASIDSTNNSTIQPSHMHINHSISSNSHNNNNNLLNTHDYGQILAMFEQQHAALLKRQQDEQKRMQEEFLRQQEELVQKMAILMAKKSNAQITPNGSLNESSVAEMSKKSNEKMLIDEVNNELPIIAIADSNGNRINRFIPESGKCIRRLHYDDNQLSPTKLSTDGSEQIEMYTVEEVRAASVIVAHAKGYLTRRLLETKKILDLRKMHYDTLELLLDISEEDSKNDSKSDVEFKYNLLQQLASVGVQIHEIFFELPMDERMDIIAKDRIIKERQQFNLNRSKSVDNGKANPKHMIVNGKSHLAKHAKR